MDAKVTQITKPTKAQLKRAGDAVRQGVVGPEVFELLKNWRNLHSLPLSMLQSSIKSKLRRLPDVKDLLIAQRLKRMPSIVSKLKRFDTMQVARMQDIGGLRIIGKNISDVYKVKNLLCKAGNNAAFLPTNSFHDYIQVPKKDGYRSIHQVFKYQGRKHPELNGLLFELQIRTALQHCWATAVEILGIIERENFKSGEGGNDFKTFFKLASAAFSLKEGTPILEEYASMTQEDLRRQLKEITAKLQIFTKLDGAAGGVHVCAQLTKIRKHEDLYYVLSLTAPDALGKRQIRVVPFSAQMVDMAESLYAAMEAEADQNHEGSLTLLINVKGVNNIKKAYPNFFLDTQIFIKELIKFIEG